MAKCNTWEEFIALQVNQNEVLLYMVTCDQVGAEGKKGIELKKHLAGMKNKNGENIHADQLEELGVLSSAPIKQDRISIWLSDQLSSIMPRSYWSWLLYNQKQFQ